MCSTTTDLPTWFKSYRYLFAACFFLSVPSGQAQAFRIISPADGATLTSGQPVPAEVEAGREAGLAGSMLLFSGTVGLSWNKGKSGRASPQEGYMATEKYRQKDSITGAPVVTSAGLALYGGSRPPMVAPYHSIGCDRTHATLSHRRYFARSPGP